MKRTSDIVSFDVTQEVWMDAECWQQVYGYLVDAAGFVPLPVVFKMLNELETHTMSKIVMLLWTIWWHRNQKCWNDKVPTVFELNRIAHDTWREWSKAQKKHNQEGRNSRPESDQRWSKPLAGILKCNVDAACYAEQNFYCIGAHLRDDKDQFVGAFAKRFEGQPAIDEAETIGVLEAFKWMQNSLNSANHISCYIETDSSHVAQALGNNAKNNSEFGVVIELGKSQLNLNKNWVSYVKRQADRVAHDLAHTTRFTVSFQVYNYYPPYIKTTIMNEMH
ncbi:hypothetical protein QL285_066497 [Trifolium repens]|jgi:hypothetical protein|nr:hypothetical protein QL285_066497 [Trifolium repens]